MSTLTGWLPMKPTDGPPLPSAWDIYWPWKKKPSVPQEILAVQQPSGAVTKAPSVVIESPSAPTTPEAAAAVPVAKAAITEATPADIAKLPDASQETLSKTVDALTQQGQAPQVVTAGNAVAVITLTGVGSVILPNDTTTAQELASATAAVQQQLVDKGVITVDTKTGKATPVPVAPQPTSVRVSPVPTTLQYQSTPAGLSYGYDPATNLYYSSGGGNMTVVTDAPPGSPGKLLHMWTFDQTWGWTDSATDAAKAAYAAQYVALPSWVPANWVATGMTLDQIIAQAKQRRGINEFPWYGDVSKVQPTTNLAKLPLFSGGGATETVYAQAQNYGTLTPDVQRLLGLSASNPYYENGYVYYNRSYGAYGVLMRGKITFLTANAMDSELRGAAHQAGVI